MTHKKLSRALVVGILAVCFGPMLAWAQTTGTISGTIRDSTGASVSGAKIAVRDVMIALVRETVSGANGSYVFPVLPVGTYVITAGAPGFAQVQTNPILLELGAEARIDLTLPISTVKQAITVTSVAPLVDVNSATLGEVVSGHQIAELPLNGRDFIQLATLQPGVTPATVQYTPSAGSKLLNQLVGTTSQVNGLRVQSNNYLLDGADNNEPFYGFVSAVPDPDTIEEFKIVTNSASAEFGRGGGGVINVITKSGTNKFHGGVFDFLRNDIFDAKNFFSTTVAPLKQNQFGGSFGGPIVKNKAFFFFNYQGSRRREGTTVNTSVPSLLERQGDFSDSATPPIDPTTGQPFPNNTIPASRINPINQSLLTFYPAPTSGATTFVSSPSAPTDGDQYTAKVDQNIGKNDRVEYNFHRNRTNLTDPTPSTADGIIGVAGFGTSDSELATRAVITEVHTFSTKVINTFRFAYNRTTLNTGIPTSRTDRFDYGFTFPSRNVNDLPLVAISGYSPFGLTNAAYFFRTDNTFQWSDDVSLVKGRHTIKLGFDFRRLRLNNSAVAYDSGAYAYTGTFSGNSFADFLLGDSLYFLQFSGNMHRRWFDSEAFSYVQDDVTVTPRFTLNVGLRWDIFFPTTEGSNRVITFRPGETSTVNPLYPEGLLVYGDPGVTKGTIKTDLHSFAPRVGFAWDPFGKGKTSVRAAYGVFFDNVVGFTPFQLVSYPGLTLIQFLYAPTNVANPYNGPSPYAGTGPLPFNLPAQYNPMDKNFTNPYAQQWNLTLQHEVKNFLFQAAYVGTKGTHLAGTHEINPALYVPGDTTAANVQSRRRYPQFTNLFANETGFNSTYHSLQLTAKHQSGGFTFLGAYTFSRTIDGVSVLHPYNGAVGQQSEAQNADDLRAEKGLAAFDVRQRFVFSSTYDLPFFQSHDLKGRVLGNWMLTAIAQAQSGTPFSALDSANPSYDGSGSVSDRTNLVPGCNRSRPSGASEIMEFFNTACFQPFPAGTGVFGNESRNIMTGPGLFQIDLGAYKTIPIRETVRLQFRAEVFNVLNHPNFEEPDNDIRSLTFGHILNTLTSNYRQLQFALKFSF